MEVASDEVRIGIRQELPHAKTLFMHYDWLVLYTKIIDKIWGLCSLLPSLLFILITARNIVVFLHLSTAVNAS